MQSEMPLKLLSSEQEADHAFLLTLYLLYLVQLCASIVEVEVVGPVEEVESHEGDRVS